MSTAANYHYTAKVIENNQLRAENERLCGYLERDRATIEQLRAELAAAQATIEQMREALTEVVDADECQDADGWLCFELSAESYHRADAALSIQCNQDALHEARALECERLAGLFSRGSMIAHRMLEEAAAHRARKEGK